MTEVFAGIARVAGVDEVGRGPLAGPVVAAAVILPPTQPIGLADSKTLSPARRHRLDLVIRASSDVSIALASVAEIDRLNILEATMLAMQRAVEGLPEPPARRWSTATGCRTSPVRPAPSSRATPASRPSPPPPSSPSRRGTL